MSFDHQGWAGVWLDGSFRLYSYLRGQIEPEIGNFLSLYNGHLPGVWSGSRSTKMKFLLCWMVIVEALHLTTGILGEKIRVRRKKFWSPYNGHSAVEIQPCRKISLQLSMWQEIRKRRVVTSLKVLLRPFWKSPSPYYGHFFAHWGGLGNYFLQKENRLPQQAVME